VYPFLEAPFILGRSPFHCVGVVSLLPESSEMIATLILLQALALPSKATVPALPVLNCGVEIVADKFFAEAVNENRARNDE